MPGFESSHFGKAEKELGEDMEKEKDYEEKWNDTEAVLKKFLTDFSANTSLIPLENYDEYLQAAQVYQEIADKHPSDINKKLLKAAELIISEAPVESAA